MDEPVAIWTGAFPLAGIQLRCHVLNDGRRIIEEGSVAELLAAIEGGATIEAAEAAAFARWERGVGNPDRRDDT